MARGTKSGATVGGAVVFIGSGGDGGGGRGGGREGGRGGEGREGVQVGFFTGARHRVQCRG